MQKSIYAYFIFFCCLISIKNTKAQQLYYYRLDSLKKVFHNQKTAKDSVIALQTLADRLFSVDNPAVFENASGYITQLLELNKKVKVIDPAPYQMLQKAIVYLKAKQYREELNTLKLAVHEFDKQHRIIDPMLIYMRLLFNKLNDQEGRLHYFQERLEYYQVNGPVENTAACYHGIAGYYAYRAIYNQAINNYLKSGEVYRKFDPAFFANEMAVAGNIYGEWGNNEKATYYLEKIALPLDKKLGDSISVSFCNYSLSGVASSDRFYAQGIKKINEAISYYHTDPEILATYYVRKAEVYLKLNQSDLAIPILLRAQEIADSGSFQIVNTTGPLETDFAFYQYYRETEDIVKAEKCLLNAIKKAHDGQSSDLELKYLKESGDFYKSQNKPVLALKYFDQYFKLLNITEQGQDKFKVAQYEIDQKDQNQKLHINQLKLEKAQQDYQIDRRNSLLWGSLVVLLLISALLIFIYNQLNINKKTLFSLRKTQTQLVQSEKMASLGELTAGIAHEIQNPLNFVNNFSEVNTELIDEMKQEISEGNYEEVNSIADNIKKNEQKINMHGKRADAIVKGMLQHSQSSSGQKEPTDINALADEYLRLSYHGLRAKDKSFNAEMVTHFDPDLPKINIISQDVGRVLLNLFNNAFYAVSHKLKTAGENYKPEITVTTTTENGKVIIKVKDNGIGIPDAIRDKIMQPFFTTKPTGEGTGLGLSLTYDMVVKGHNGKIDVNTKEGEFTEFMISLPV